jgi:glycosyltransferase involved in cell wall biosynthesis
VAKTPIDISVIVPVYNGGRKIRRCVRALKQQNTERSYEIIVVDDGSTDGSLQGIEAFGVRVVRQSNQGPAAARNLGVQEARGEIVLFTDGDCEPVQDWIDQMVGRLEDPAISGVKGSYLTRQKRIVARFVQREYESKYERMKRDDFIDFIDTYAAAFVKADFLAAGGYDTRFRTASVEDQEFSFRMWAMGFRMVFNPDAKVYHTHSQSLWNYMRKKFKIGYWKALVLKDHPKKIVRDSHTPQTLKLEMFFSLLLVACLGLCPFDEVFVRYALFPLTGFLATTLPFMVKLTKKDPAVALTSPFLLFVRATALSLGLIVGGVRFHVLKRRRESRLSLATKGGEG